MTLYEIDELIAQTFEQAIDEETGEIDMEAYKKLDALKMERTQKIENIALFYKNLSSDAEQIKAEAKKLADRAKSYERRAEWLKEYLKYATNGEKMATSRVQISFRKTKSVECTLEDISVLPSQFLRYKDPELNKTEVKKFIEAGGTVEGCQVVENLSMTIK